MDLQKSSELYAHTGSKSNISQVYCACPLMTVRYHKRERPGYVVHVDVTGNSWRWLKLKILITEDVWLISRNLSMTAEFQVWHVYVSVYCKHEFVCSSPFSNAGCSGLHSMLIRLQKSRNIKNFPPDYMDHIS